MFLEEDPGPDETDILRTIGEAQGYACLGLYDEALEVIDALPEEARHSAPVVAVKLVACTLAGKWETGFGLCSEISPLDGEEEREAAGRFFLACAETSCREEKPGMARACVAALLVVWPEGRPEADASKTLQAALLQ